MSARSYKRGDLRRASANKTAMRQQLQTNPHGEFEHAPTTDVADPSGSPGHIIATAPTRRLPVMSHHWYWRAGYNGGICAEPGASASARLTRRQAGHGGRRNTLFAWERGALAYMTHSNRACVCVWVYVLVLFAFFSVVTYLCFD